MFRNWKLKNKRAELIEKLNLKAPLANGLSVRLAETAPEIIESAKLLHNSYVRRKIIKSELGKLRLSLYGILPSTCIVVVRAGGLLAGTIQVHQKTETNLPIEESFQLDSVFTSPQGTKLKVVEVGSLALHELKAGRLEEVYLPMLAYVMRICTAVLGADRIVIAVQPGTASFYEALFGFKPFKGGEARPHKFAAGAEAVGLYLEVKEVAQFLATHYRKLGPEKNLEAFMLTNAELLGCFHFPNAMPPHLHPKAAAILEEVYANKSQLLARAPAEVRKSFAALYPDTDEYRWLFKVDTQITQRTTRRHTVDFSVRLTDSFGLHRMGRVIDLSSGGMKILLTEKTLPPSIDEVLRVEITPPLLETIAIQTKLRRYDLKEYSLGLQVIESNPEYLSLVDDVRGTALTTTGGTGSGLTPTGSGPKEDVNQPKKMSRLADLETASSITSDKPIKIPIAPPPRQTKK